MELLEKITLSIIQYLIQNKTIELSATQKSLCIPIIDRIYKKMVVGIKFSGIKVENGLIGDGHHRYIASLLADFSIERIPTISTSATVAVAWKLVIFEEEDWDTPAKIMMLNKQDAIYNGIPLEEIVSLLK